MIKAGIVAMAVIGCDCDAKICEYIETTGTEWSSVAACEADLKARIVTQHENYPLVIAVCRDASEGAGRMAEAATATTAAANAEASAIVSPLLASSPRGNVSSDGEGRITTLFRTLNGYVSVRDTVGGVWTSASRRALETASWLRSAVAFD